VRAFAERVERELLRLATAPVSGTVETREDLTAQDAQIARLAGAGCSNPEIVRTVSQREDRRVPPEEHLHSAKLGIASRTGLDGALPQRTDVGAAGVNQASVRRDR
jgi:hypothetical protein